MPIRLTVLLLFAAVQALAQDANYWSSSYGPGGFLVPGATVANNGDSGVFFYNPALLAFSRKSAASISGTIYQYQYIKIKDGAGTGLDLKSSAGSIIPQIVSNNISLKLQDRPFTIAYALLHDPLISFTTSQRKDAKLDVLSDYYSPGPETYIGQYTAQNTIDETVGVLSAGLQLSPRWAVGVSIDGRIRKQNYSQTISSTALFNIKIDTALPPIASTDAGYLLTYTHLGLRFRTGIAFEAGKHDHLGFLVSTPVVRLGGSGTIVADYHISNIRQDSSFTVYILASSRQTKLPAKYKMPLSFALGYTHDFASGAQLFFSTEYFFRIKEYNVITPRNESFIRPDTISASSAADALRFKDARTAILNFAIGFSHPLTQTVAGFVTFRTDLNYAKPRVYGNSTDGYIANTAYWDLYHVQLGANLKKRKFNLRMGVLLAYGKTNGYPQNVNYDHPNESNLLIGDPHDTKATRLSGGLMLSYIHNL